MARRLDADALFSGRSRAAVLICLIAAIATLWIAAAVQIDRTWVSSSDRAHETVEQLGRTAEGIINRQLLQTDGALASVPSLLAGASSGSASFEPLALSRLLRGLNFQHFTFRDIVVLHRDGKVVASARAGSSQRVLSLGLHALDNGLSPGASSVVGPIRNALTGEWATYLVRPLNITGAQDLFVAAEIPSTMMTSPLATIGNKKGLTLRLERGDGTLIASLPPDEPSIGTVTQSPHGRRHPEPREAPFAESEPPAVAVWRPTLYSDFGVSLRYETAVAMEDWARDRDRLVLIVLTASGAIALVAFGYLLVLRRQAKLEADRVLAQRMLEDAIEAMSDGFVMWDAEDRLVTCNGRYLELYEKSAPFLQPGKPFLEIMRKGAENGQYPQAGTDLDGFLADIAEWRKTAHGSLERLLPDGRWLMITERRTRSGGSVGIRTDITAIKTAVTELSVAKDRLQSTMSELEQQHTRFDAALNNMSQGLLMGDADGRITVCNGRFLSLFGLPLDTIATGQDIASLFDRIAETGLQDQELLHGILRRQTALASSGQSSAFITIGNDGRAYSISQRPMPEGGFVATYEDVTEQQRIEQRMRHQALHDMLTGLPNRMCFRTGLATALQTVDEERGSVTLLYLDLDHFKEVNDTLGHPVGDALLVAVAERLRHCLGPSDIVARLGGDEFAVAVRASKSHPHAVDLSQSILEELSRDYLIDGHLVSVGVSIGAAVAAEAGMDADTLLKHADLALYEAKGRGRGRHCLFEPSIADQLRERLKLELELRRAVEDEAFEVTYQPQYDLHSNAITGFEALLRWSHADRGSVGPGVFIPIVESLGLIGKLGAWVLQRACTDIAQMPGAPRVAVNVSPHQLRSDDFTEQVLKALRDSRLSPTRLELEITENALLADDERIIDQLKKLRDLGVRIALDDFGVGYSSLNYIRRVPLDKIKIDQVFVREATERADCLAIIKAIVGLARQLNIETTAEGIENAEQLGLVRSLGCDEGQGYLLSRPCSLLNAVRLLSQQRRLLLDPAA